jgi:mannose-6-phosphate isomerase-like protein (cupin superfamily)
MTSNEPRIIDLNDSQDYQPLLQGSPQTCGMRAGRVFLKPGQECGIHSTKAHEETLVFLAGRGQAKIREQTVEVGAGKIAYIPPHTEHNIMNNTDKPLVYIYCVAPIQNQ